MAHFGVNATVIGLTIAAASLVILQGWLQTPTKDSYGRHDLSPRPINPLGPELASNQSIILNLRVQRLRSECERHIDVTDDIAEKM